MPQHSPRRIRRIRNSLLAAGFAAAVAIGLGAGVANAVPGFDSPSGSSMQSMDRSGPGFAAPGTGFLHDNQVTPSLGDQTQSQEAPAPESPVVGPSGESSDHHNRDRDGDRGDVNEPNEHNDLNETGEHAEVG